MGVGACIITSTQQTLPTGSPCAHSNAYRSPEILANLFQVYPFVIKLEHELDYLEHKHKEESDNISSGQPLVHAGIYSLPQCERTTGELACKFTA